MLIPAVIPLNKTAALCLREMLCLNSFLTVPRMPPKFKFASLRHVVPSREWLGNYAFGFGIPPCYLTGWRIIRNKSSVQISGSTSQTWRRAWSRHVPKGGVNCVIQQHQLWIFGMLTASDDILCVLSSYLSFDTDCFTEFHWAAQVQWRLTWPWTRTGVLKVGGGLFIWVTLCILGIF